MTKEKLAYAAGLIDGEGSVVLEKRSKNSPYRTPGVSATSTSYELLKFLKDNFGGYIVSKKSYKDNHSASWGWAMKSDAALKFLKDILPYMREKKKIKRAKLLLKDYKRLTNPGGQYTEKQKAAKLKFEEKFFSF